MRRAARKDINHNSVLQPAKDIGAEVLDLHSLGGALDAMIGFRGRLWLVEIKSPGKRKDLTPAERVTIEGFSRVGCAPLVVETADELLRGIGAI